MKRLACLMVLLAATGCAYEVSDPAEAEIGDEDLGTALSALQGENSLEPNSLEPNGLQGNGLQGNGLQGNGLTPETISSTAMSCLQDPGLAGLRCRALMKYIVSCALPLGETFEFSYVDYLSVTQNVTLTGSVGLAPEWLDGPISTSKQQWVSACVGARTNYFGVSVLISMRGTNSALATTLSERTTYTNEEGAFWGNLFGATPFVKSCQNDTKVTYVRGKQRACAAGYFDGSSVYGCGMMARAGSCSSLCTEAADTDSSFSACDGVSEVIRTFLD